MTYFQCGPLMTRGGLEWEVESTTFTHSSADWWDLLLPLAETSDRRAQRLYCLIRKTLASGVNGIAKVPKRNGFTEVGLEPSNVRSPIDALTHSAIARSMICIDSSVKHASKDTGDLEKIHLGSVTLGDFPKCPPMVFIRPDFAVIQATFRKPFPLSLRLSQFA